jgi:hypothetical protein
MLAALPTALFAAAYHLNVRNVKVEQFLGGLVVYLLVILLVLWKVWQSRFWRTMVVVLVLVKVVAVVAIVLLDTSSRPAARSAPPGKAAPASLSGGRTG